MVEENIKLQKDDMLVVYTDGVTEAMNGKREQYGEQRFVEFVKTNGKSTARDFIAKLDDELKEFTQGYPQNDDITIVAVKEKKTESMVLNKIARDIKKLRDKGMKSKDIEKKLGISIDEFNRVRAQKEDRGNKKEVIRFMAFEQKKDLMKFILDDPEAMPGDYVDRLNEKYKTMIDVKLVESELKRIRLLTVKARILYAAERKR
jgi:glycerophosphoryl diester phosphodiesterase